MADSSQEPKSENKQKRYRTFDLSGAGAGSIDYRDCAGDSVISQVFRAIETAEERDRTELNQAFLTTVASRTSIEGMTPFQYLVWAGAVIESEGEFVSVAASSQGPEGRIATKWKIRQGVLQTKAYTIEQRHVDQAEAVFDWIRHHAEVEHNDYLGNARQAVSAASVTRAAEGILAALTQSWVWFLTGKNSPVKIVGDAPPHDIQSLVSAYWQWAPKQTSGDNSSIQEPTVPGQLPIAVTSPSLSTGGTEPGPAPTVDDTGTTAGDTPPAPAKGGGSSQWQGEVGKSITVKMFVTSVQKSTNTAWGGYLNKMVDTDHNRYQWFSTGAKARLKHGQTVTLTGKVKRHEDYFGTRITHLTACTIDGEQRVRKQSSIEKRIAASTGTHIEWTESKNYQASRPVTNVRSVTIHNTAPRDWATGGGGPIEPMIYASGAFTTAPSMYSGETPSQLLYNDPAQPPTPAIVLLRLDDLLAELNGYWSRPLSECLSSYQHLGVQVEIMAAKYPAEAARLEAAFDSLRTKVQQMLLGDEG